MEINIKYKGAEASVRGMTDTGNMLKDPISGRPVIMYKLDGVPDEYDNYLNYVPDNSVDALKQKIVEICSLSLEERNRMGQLAREFVLNEKNSEKQVKKIIDLCE